MAAVSFASAPTIHNLEDASSPASLDSSLIFDRAVSPTPPTSDRHIRTRARSRSSSMEDLDSLQVPSLERGSHDKTNGDDKLDRDEETEHEELPDDGSVDDIPPTPSQDEDSPFVIFGYTIPSVNRISASIVRYAPCFWGTRDQQFTDRAVLIRLTVMCAFFAFMQIGSMVFLSIAFFTSNLADRSDIRGREDSNVFTPNLWSLNPMIYIAGVVGVFLLTSSVFALKAIKQIRLFGSLRYMWGLLWILPVEIFVVFSLFDYHRVTSVWVKHWWYTPSMAWFRKLYCREGTDRTRCTVPICGLPTFGIEAAIEPLPGQNSQECIEGELEWCSFFFNDTDCRSIRNHAQSSTKRFSYIFYSINAAWGLLLVILLLLTVNVLEGIITRPIVQKSRESNVPRWLLFPIVGSAAAGFVLSFVPTSGVTSSIGAEYYWIGIAYIVISSMFLIAALLGWFLSAFSILNSRDKQTKQLAALLFCATLAATLLALAVIFVSSIAYSTNIVDVDLSGDDRGSFACAIDNAESCSFCGGDPIEGVELAECPEWSSSDVASVLRTQLKQSATMAAILVIYAAGAFRYGLVLRTHISQYEIDYV